MAWGMGVGQYASLPMSGSNHAGSVDPVRQDDGEMGILGTILHGLEGVARGDWVDDLGRGVGNVLDALIPDAKPKPRPKPKRQAVQMSPYDAVIRQLMAGGGGTRGNAAYKRSSQRAINDAVLAARKEFDNAIVGARQDYGAATKNLDRDAAGLQSNMAGAVRGAEDARAKGLATAAAAEQAAQAQTGGGSAMAARMLGGSEAQAQDADALTRVAIAADAAGDRSNVNSQATSVANLAGDMGAWSAANAQETKGKLRRESGREVNRLRAQRAAAISAARAGAVERLEAQAARAEDTRRQDLGLMLQLIKAKDDSSLAREDLGLRRTIAEAEARANAMPDPSDALSLWSQIGKAQISMPKGKDEKTGKIIYGKEPAFTAEQAYTALVTQGLPEDVAAALTGYKRPAPSMGEELGGWLMNVLREAR